MVRTHCTRVQTRCQLGTPWTVNAIPRTNQGVLWLYLLFDPFLCTFPGTKWYLNLEVQYVIWARRMLTWYVRKGCVYCTVQLVLPLGLHGSHIKMSVSNCALIMLLGGFRHTLTFHLYRYTSLYSVLFHWLNTLLKIKTMAPKVCVCGGGGGVFGDTIEKPFWILPRTVKSS